MFAAWRSPPALSRPIRACTSCKRLSGSGCSTGSEASIADTRVPARFIASGGRTETGTRVRSELRLGVSPRRNSVARKLSVIAASATSLRVTPNVWHTVSTSLSDTRAALYRRMPASEPCSRDPAAGVSTPVTNCAAPRAVWVATPVVAIDARHRPPAQVSGLRPSPAERAVDGGGSVAARMSVAKVAPAPASQTPASIRVAAIPSATPVMNLHQGAPPPVREAFDDPALPQRVIAIQPALHQIGDGPEQHRVVARLRQRRPAQVVGDVERGVLHPFRCRNLERVLAHALPEAGHAADPFGQRRGQRRLLGKGSVDDGRCADHQADVPVGVLCLQEAGLQRRQLLHCRSSPIHDDRLHYPPRAARVDSAVRPQAAGPVSPTVSRRGGRGPRRPRGS
nr:hypothetical protein [Mycobacterium helveticum]